MAMQEYKGLFNYGATCYINSTVQAFLHSLPTSMAIRSAPIDQKIFDGCVGGFDKNYGQQATALPETCSKNVVASLQILDVKAQRALQGELGTRALCAAMGKRELRELQEQDDANTVQKKFMECLEDVFKAAYGDPKSNEALMDKFRGVFKEAVYCPLDLYKNLLISHYDQAIKCAFCKHESVSQQISTDFQIQLMGSFFDSLAAYFAQEALDGYKCAKCGNEQCTKSFRISNVAASLIFTLNRFVLDYMTGDYRKDSRPIEMPACIDVFGMLHLKESELANEKDISEYLKVTCLPWCYPASEADDKIKEAISKVPGLQQYLQCYTGCETGPESGFCDGPDVPEPFYSFPVLTAPPEYLYIINAVVNHTGNMQSGHYYTYVNKFDVYHKKFVFFEFNDQLVSEMSYPYAALKNISGKEDNTHETTDQNQFFKHFGDTGYMYYYSQYKLLASPPVSAPVELTDKLRYEIENENVEAEKTIYLYDFTVLSNYNRDPSSMTAFSQMDDYFRPVYQFTLRDFDTRVSVQNFVRQLFETQLPFSIYQVQNSHDFLQQNLRRYKRVFQASDNESMLVSALAPRFYTTKRQASRRISLFVEFYYNNVPQFDKDADYVIFKQIRPVAAPNQGAALPPEGTETHLVRDPQLGVLEVVKVVIARLDVAQLNKLAQQLYAHPSEVVRSTVHQSTRLQLLHLKLACALQLADNITYIHQYMQYLLPFGRGEHGALRRLYSEQKPEDYDLCEVFSGSQYYVELTAKPVPASVCDLLNYTQPPVDLAEISGIYALMRSRKQFCMVHVFAGEFAVLELQQPRDATILQLYQQIQAECELEAPPPLRFCAIAEEYALKPIGETYAGSDIYLHKIPDILAPHLRCGYQLDDNNFYVSLQFPKPTPYQLRFSIALLGKRLAAPSVIPIPVNFIGKTPLALASQKIFTKIFDHIGISAQQCTFYAVYTNAPEPVPVADITSQTLTDKYASIDLTAQLVVDGRRTTEYFKAICGEKTDKWRFGKLMRSEQGMITRECVFVRYKKFDYKCIYDWASRTFKSSGTELQFCVPDGGQLRILGEDEKIWDQEIIYVY